MRDLVQPELNLKEVVGAPNRPLLCVDLEMEGHLVQDAEQLPPPVLPQPREFERPDLRLDLLFANAVNGESSLSPVSSEYVAPSDSPVSKICSRSTRQCSATYSTIARKGSPSTSGPPKAHV